MKTQQGILYVVTGERYIREAMESARSARKCMPELPLAIFCDDESLVEREYFTHVATLENPEYSFFDRIRAMNDSPFEKTLFLDSDTVVIEPCLEIFDLLERFDIAAAHAPVRVIHQLDACPECFPEFNCGVIAYRNSAEVRQVLSRWESLYRSQGELEKAPLHDQPAFRQVLYESSLRLTMLPPEYNLRTIFPYFAGGLAKVKILHGRDPSLRQVRRGINRRLRPRVGVPWLWSLRIRWPQLRRKIKEALRRPTA